MNMQFFIRDVLPEAGSVMNVVLFNSLVILVGASCLAMLLKLLPIRSAAINQSLWLLVLIAGVVFFRVPIEVPSPFSETTYVDAPASQPGIRDGMITMIDTNERWDVPPSVSQASNERVFKVDNLKNVEPAENSPTAIIPPPELDTNVAQNENRNEDTELPKTEIATLFPDVEQELPTLNVQSEATSAVPPPLDIAAKQVTTHGKSAEASVRDSLQLSQALFLVWISGGLLLVLCSMLRFWKFRRFVGRDEVTPDDNEVAQWSNEWKTACADSGVQRIPRICFTESIGPGLCPGGMTPCLILPVVLWRELDASQRQAVLRHEAAHLVRRDLWRSLLVRLLALPHWFNPFAWLAVRRFEEAAEWACDEAATKSSIETGCEFAELLLSLTSKNGFQPVVVGQPLASNKSIKERIARLVQSDDHPHRSPWRTAIMLTVSCFLLAASAVDVRLIAQSEVPSTEPTKPADNTPAVPTTNPSDNQPADVASPQPTEDAERESPKAAEPATSETPTSADGATGETTDEPAADSTSSTTQHPPDPIPSQPGFEFEPWYELDENRLWRQIGWKIDLIHLPDDTDAFVDLMQSPRFKDSALDLSSSIVATLGVRRLKDLPNIESLRLGGGVTVSVSQMKDIAKLPRLRKLDLSFLDINDDHIGVLPLSQTLQVLNLQRTKVSSASIPSLGELEKLEELYLRWTMLGGWDDPHRIGPTKYNFFNHPTWIVERLKNLKHLHTLQIHAEDIGACDGIEVLSGLENLELIRGGIRELNTSDLQAISRLPKLRTLTLPNAPKVEQVRLLRPLTRLRKLRFRNAGKEADALSAEIRQQLPLTDFGKSYEPTLDDLTTVKFKDVPLNDGLDYFSKMHDIPIYIDQPGLEEIGAFVDEPITAVISGVSLRTTLDRLLSDYALMAIPHHHGLTVTSRDGSRLYRVHYDLSELLHGVEAADNLTVQLSQIIQKMIAPNEWRQEFPVLPHSDSSEEEMATAEITEAGTTLMVMASASTHAQIRAFVNQLAQGEDSELFDVELRQIIDRQYSEQPHRREDGTLPPEYRGKALIKFDETPLIDCCDYLSRQWHVPIIVDVVSLTEVGVEPLHPLDHIFEYDTLAEALDIILEPLKLTWVYEDDVIKVKSLDNAASRPTIVVHQLFDGFRLPVDRMSSIDWRDQLRNVCQRGTGLKEPNFEIWFGRLIVQEPWRNQLSLARLLRKWDRARRQVRRIQQN